MFQVCEKAPEVFASNQIDFISETVMILHSRNLLHNDWKQRNVVVNEGNPLLIDFGFSSMGGINSDEDYFIEEVMVYDNLKFCA